VNLTWLLRMAKWARHPPNPRQVRIVLVVLALVAVLLLIEHVFGWPEWATVNRLRR